MVPFYTEIMKQMQLHLF